ncbi:MAG: serine hydrolase [Bacteroidia bacterium]|nr:serine hydrolase [Bacteroidia bacterium]
MKQFITSIVFILWLCNSGVAQPPFAGFDDYIEKGMKDWKIPGMSVAVVKNHQIIYAKGYGVKETGKPEKVDSETIFAIGSNTKAFTAAALANLEYDRKLKLNDKIQAYFSAFQMEDTFDARQITLRDLLCHRIGLSTWEGDFTHWGSKYSKEELISKMRYLPKAHDIRTSFGYCNVAYMLAGEVIPKVTKGVTWEKYIQDKFFVPLDMSRSCTSTNELSALGNVATPHTMWRKSLITLPWRNIDNLAACGSINSTATDMARWLIMQMDSGRYEGRQVLPWIVVRNSHIPQIPINVVPYFNKNFPDSHFLGYGLGWFVRDYHGKMLVFHSGAVDGMVSMTVFLPEEQTGIVILTNSDAHNFISALMYQFADNAVKAPYKNWEETFLEQHFEEEKEKNEIEDSRNPDNKPSMELRQYAGHYFHSHYGQITLRFSGNTLTAYPSAHPGITGTLIPWDGDKFICEWTDKMWDRSTMNFTVENRQIIDFSMETRPDLLDPTTYIFEKIKE